VRNFGLDSNSLKPLILTGQSPLTFFHLLALTSFHFDGVSEYLDDLVAYICAPRLPNLVIIYLEEIVSGAPHVVQFISRASMLISLDEAHVDFPNRDVSFLALLSQTSSPPGSLFVDMIRYSMRRDIFAG